MEKLTKEQAIAEHRKMWRWIAEETKKRREIVKEEDYIKKYFQRDVILCHCFCCEYTSQRGGCADLFFCEFCPIDWNSECDELMCEDYDETEENNKGLLGLWEDAKSWQTAAKLAKQIAELPERFSDVLDDE